MTSPPERPADLPDLPILLRFGLRTLFAAAICCATLGYLTAIGAESPLLIAQEAIPAIAILASAALFFVWFGATQSAKRRMAKTQWWKVNMKGTGSDLTFEWQPQKWEDLVPKRSLMLNIFLFIGLLWVLGFAVSISVDPSNAAIARSAFIASPPHGTAFVVTVFSAGIFLLSQSTCKARLKSDARFLAPPMVFTFRLFDGFYRWSRVYIPSRKLAGVAFDRTGAVISRETRRNAQVGFTIPTRDPDQRRAIADWATSHNIPITGDI